MTASPQPTDGREALNVDLIAAAVHEGRFPDGKAAPNYCSFDDERDGGKEYCRRIARSVMAAQPISPQTKLAAAEKLAKRVLAYLEQPTGVPPSSNMECDCELYFLATDFLDAAPATLSAHRVEAPVHQPTSPSDAGSRKPVCIEHDGFEGTIIGHYTTREGKRGVVLQQTGTRVVHVYSEKWIKP